jgi:hypothetical protein
MQKLLLCLMFMLAISPVASQQLKSVRALRVSSPPKVDGSLKDSCWNKAEVATDFIQRDLHPGLPSEQKSEVRILYDDEAIYIGAKLYDTHPDSILRELSTRDNEANADLFGVLFDTYNDDINAYGFFVTAAGTQIDARYSSEGQDFDWNAVWMSSVKMDSAGWNVEMRIPYSALRFAKKDIQTWGFNVCRKIRRLREMAFWNPLDPKIDAFVRQFGDLTGLENIKPPVRLALSPYVAGIINHYPYNDPKIQDLTYSASGGMDLKYGLSDAFTLDMTLVPDFSQVQSDNQVLNLSPFEVQFQERRPFFTEGTELFNKGGLFYSRRVGGTPMGYYDVYGQAKPGESVVKNPSQAKLLNATKLSGRTSGKLGIGLFNAVSGDTYATLQDTLGNERKVLTSPLTNYNIIVLDQALKNNSFINLVNTNVTRDGHFYDANVTGLGWRANNKSNMYSIGGFGAMSQQFYPDSAKPFTGYSANFDFGKSGGNFKWNVYGSMNTDKYDPNDLGIQFINNNLEGGINLIYNYYKPFWKLNNFFSNIRLVYQRMYNPDAFGNLGIHSNIFTTFSKRFLTTGCWYALEPIITYDYYEPRIFGRFYTFPKNYSAGGFISTDYRKPFAIDVSLSGRSFEENQREQWNIDVSPRLRASNKLSFFYTFSRLQKQDDIGFVNYDYFTDTITFGRRNILTVTNTFSTEYKFTNRMSLSFRLRHYWSKVRYSEYYQLDERGYLNSYAYFGNHDVNFNAFNIDMVFFWQFAPGSELNIVWKNAVLKREPVINNDYYDNFRGSLNSPQTNTISIKILYYIDYLTLRRALRKERRV